MKRHADVNFSDPVQSGSRTNPATPDIAPTHFPKDHVWPKVPGYTASPNYVGLSQ